MLVTVAITICDVFLISASIRMFRRRVLPDGTLFLATAAILAGLAWIDPTGFQFPATLMPWRYVIPIIFFVVGFLALGTYAVVARHRELPTR
jgi:hypothetical protein